MMVSVTILYHYSVRREVHYCFSQTKRLESNFACSSTLMDRQIERKRPKLSIRASVRGRKCVLKAVRIDKRVSLVDRPVGDTSQPTWKSVGYCKHQQVIKFSVK